MSLRTMPKRPHPTVLSRTRSVHDHNIVPGAQSALNVRAHKDRLPGADYVTRAVATMSGWDTGAPRVTPGTPKPAEAWTVRERADRAAAERLAATLARRAQWSRR